MLLLLFRALLSYERADNDERRRGPFFWVFFSGPSFCKGEQKVDSPKCKRKETKKMKKKGTKGGEKRIGKSKKRERERETSPQTNAAFDDVNACPPPPPPRSKSSPRKSAERGRWRREQRRRFCDGRTGKRKGYRRHRIQTRIRERFTSRIFN